MAAALSVAMSHWNAGIDPAMATPEPVTYKAGQVWAIITPPDQPDARLTVLKVDTNERLGKVFHISLSGVELPNGSRVVPHMPLSESALAQTVTKLIREGEPVTADVEGYRQWLRAVEAGKGGVFTVPVAQSFETVKEAYTHQPR
jgi:hypothetical protein